MLAQRAADTLANLVILVIVPLLVYGIYQRWRHGRGLGEILDRVGLRWGEPGYLRYALAAASVTCVWIWLRPPDLEVITREGTAASRFAGAGLGFEALGAAVLYAMVQTGFTEEFFFRGMITGSLSRRMSANRANLLQATLFLLPHLLLLYIMPEEWPVLILVFFGSLFSGWLRIASGSIIGPWLVHGAANLAVAVSVLVRTAPA